MNLLRWACFLLAGICFWLYPYVFLVPDEYRQGLWSLDYNVGHRGLVVGREVYEYKSLVQNHTVYRVTILTAGQKEHFWVANDGVNRELVNGELVSFETRGKVVVLAKLLETPPPIISLLY